MLFRKKATPRVLMYIDHYGWAFDALAKGMKPHVEGFDIDIAAYAENPSFSSYDIVHGFGLYQPCEGAKCPVLKGIYNTNSSIRNQPIAELLREQTQDATALIAPITSMQEEIRSSGITLPIFLLPEGVDTTRLSYSPPPTGPLRVGWAGNPLRCYKRFYMAQLACADLAEFVVADGTLTEEQMVDFYSTIDVILCTSEYGEGCPRPLIEGMSRGCFPVSFPVGVAPDIIHSEQTGLIVEDESIDGMRTAMQWCIDNLTHIRAQRRTQHEHMVAHRSWNVISPRLTEIYHQVLAL